MDGVCSFVVLAILHCVNLNQLESFLDDHGGDGITTILMDDFHYTDLDLLTTLDLPDLELVNVLRSGKCAVRKEAPCTLVWASSTTATTSTSLVVSTQFSIQISGNDKVVLGCVIGSVVLIVLVVVIWLVKRVIVRRQLRRERFRGREIEEFSIEEIERLVDEEVDEEEDDVVFEQTPIAMRTRSHDREAAAAAPAATDETTC